MTVSSVLIRSLILVSFCNFSIADFCKKTGSEGLQKNPKECNVYFYPGLKSYSGPKGFDILSIDDSARISVLTDNERNQMSQERIGFSGVIPNVIYWVNKNDLIFYDDFKAVSSCFPIKSMTLSTEYSSVEMNFDENGLGLIGAGSVKWQAFKAKNLYTFRVVDAQKCVDVCSEPGFEDCLCDEMALYVDAEKKLVIGGADYVVPEKYKVEWRSVFDRKECESKKNN